MAIQKVGINLSGITNVTLPDFDLKNDTVEFFNDIPVKANEVSNGYVGLMILSGLFTYLMWVLSRDNFYGGDFNLSNLRSIGISAAICSILGLVCLNLGYFTRYYHVVIFIVITFVCWFAIWKAEK